jgi:plasmid stabilization system protein ParE
VTDDLSVYRVEYADAFKQEFEQAYLWLSFVTSPESAARWADNLQDKVDDLATLPRRFERAPKYLSSGKDVRRLLVRPCVARAVPGD